LESKVKKTSARSKEYFSRKHEISVFRQFQDKVIVGLNQRVICTFPNSKEHFSLKQSENLEFFTV